MQRRMPISGSSTEKKVKETDDLWAADLFSDSLL